MHDCLHAARLSTFLFDRYFSPWVTSHSLWFNASPFKFFDIACEWYFVRWHIVLK